MSKTADTSVRCAEHLDSIPFSSDHLWRADLHHCPNGPCLKCGMEYSEYAERSNRRLHEVLRRGWAMTAVPTTSSQLPQFQANAGNSTLLLPPRSSHTSSPDNSFVYLSEVLAKVKELVVSIEEATKLLEDKYDEDKVSSALDVLRRALRYRSTSDSGKGKVG